MQLIGKLPVTQEISKTTRKYTVQEIHQESLNHHKVRMALTTEKTKNNKKETAMSTS